MTAAPAGEVNGPVDARRHCRSVVLAAAPRLLGLLDREPPSPTAGSFDRGHWAWKFRDFPINIAQASMMTLAQLWRADWPDNPYRGHDRLARWIGSSIERTLARQHRNGAFDTIAPWSQDLGVTLLLVLSIATTLEALGDAMPEPLAGRAKESLRRACRFAEAAEEDYAFISNHHGFFALGLLRASRVLGDQRLAERGDAAVAAILAHQSADGWFEEYGGPDPGYETFGLTYLALYDRERPRPGLSAALGRSAAFLSHCVHPDGSVGGNYGSRQTAQFAPGGVAVLSATVPIAAAILRFLIARAARGNLVTPLTCDDDNLPLLSYSYAVAAESAGTAGSGTPPLPCESSGPLKRFDASQIVVAATPRYYAIANLAKGGVLRVFDRRTERLAYEDSGMVVESGGTRWVSHLLGTSHPAPAGTGTAVTVSARFAELKLEELTPAKFLVLRLLNLTVFRSVRLGVWVRGMIIARLITGRRAGHWGLERSLAFGDETIHIRDGVSPDAARPVTACSLERSLLPFHMGSAKYFQASELQSWPFPALAGWPARLSEGHRMTLSQHITFTPSGVDIRHADDDAAPARPLEHA